MPINIIRLIEAFAINERREESFTPAPAQTVFNIAATPTTDSEVTFRLNGVAYETGTDFSVVGTTVTWLKAITLDATDTVEIVYYI